MSDITTAPHPCWLTLIGIGEDGPAGLSETAQHLIRNSALVFGGVRHLELMAPLIRGEAKSWENPFDKSVAAIVARRGTPVTVLASGDPFCYGVGATLSRFLSPAEMRVLPAPSALSLAAARMGWPLQEVKALSLHGRPIDLLRPHLHPGQRILALTSDDSTPAEIARLLDHSGFGASIITVMEALGGDRERIRHVQASDFDFTDINPLNLCAIEVVASAHARIIGRSPGLSDDLFSHDGQMTKREIRAITLSALEPRFRELLWDVGAGSGSVAIEWMLADPSLRAIAIEQSADRIARIKANASALGVPGLHVVEGKAPAALAALPLPDVMPDAIFIGGGGSDPGVLDTAMRALKPGGRLVANAVTLEMESLLLAAQAQWGGSLIRIAIDRAAPIGTMTGWRPAMPVTQWCWVKGVG